MTMIQIKHVYEPAAKEDGARFLVERLWPRGMKKEALHMDAWCKDLRPATICAAGSATIQPNGRNSNDGIGPSGRQSCSLPTAVGRSQAGQHYAPIQRSRHGT